MISAAVGTGLASGMLEWFARGPYESRPGVFVDRDGVVNEHIAGGYVLESADFRWLPGAVRALQRLTASGRNLFFVTNQSCINRGLLDITTFEALMSEMVATLAAAGVATTGWMCCPHRPDEGCSCRKPGTAMLERAAAVTGVSLPAAVLLGDSDSDIEAASRVDMPSILIARNTPPSLAAAVDRILKGAL